jgi:hypothetical protein
MQLVCIMLMPVCTWLSRILSQRHLLPEYNPFAAVSSFKARNAQQQIDHHAMYACKHYNIA